MISPLDKLNSAIYKAALDGSKVVLDYDSAVFIENEVRDLTRQVASLENDIEDLSDELENKGV